MSGLLAALLISALAYGAALAQHHHDTGRFPRGLDWIRLRNEPEDKD